MDIKIQSKPRSTMCIHITCLSMSGGPRLLWILLIHWWCPHLICVWLCVSKSGRPQMLWMSGIHLWCPHSLCMSLCVSKWGRPQMLWVIPIHSCPHSVCMRCVYPNEDVLKCYGYNLYTRVLIQCVCCVYPIEDVLKCYGFKVNMCVRVYIFCPHLPCVKRDYLILRYTWLSI